MGRTSPGYRFRQEYLPQFETGLISETETQDQVLNIYTGMLIFLSAVVIEQEPDI